MSYLKYADSAPLSGMQGIKGSPAVALSVKVRLIKRIFFYILLTELALN